MDEPTQFGPPGAGEFPVATRVDHVIAVFLTVDQQGPGMEVLPPHAGLDDLVELEQRAVLDLDTPPDRRLEVVRGDLQSVDLLGLCHCCLIVCLTKKSLPVHTALLVLLAATARAGIVPARLLVHRHRT